MDERTAKLLIKAVRTLPQREQDQLLAALIVGGPAEPATLTQPAPPPDVVYPYPMSAPLPAPMVGAAGQTTMLPVRLPPELHGRLREWCTVQGFSMASVVRGLVERFLDEQEGKAPARKRPATAARSKRRPTARG